MKTKAIFNWSGGKDSALSLYKILQSNEFEIISLLTTVNKALQRVSMHGIRVELLEKQLDSIGIPSTKLLLPEIVDMDTYHRLMLEILFDLKLNGAEVSIYGDIFLEDVRTYRESLLTTANLRGKYPLWKRESKEVLKEFLDLGFKTVVCCVNEAYLDKSFVGRIIDENFIKDLPPSVDPCGENGEFHTFVFDGPIFKYPITYTLGNIVYKTFPIPKNIDMSTKDKTENDVLAASQTSGFWFCDLIPS